MMNFSSLTRTFLTVILDFIVFSGFGQPFSFQMVVVSMAHTKPVSTLPAVSKAEAGGCLESGSRQLVWATQDLV